MTVDFNIRDNNWNLSYPYYLIHIDVLWEVANSLNPELSIPINSVSTQYTDNSQDLNFNVSLSRSGGIQQLLNLIQLIKFF